MSCFWSIACEGCHTWIFDLNHGSGLLQDILAKRSEIEATSPELIKLLAQAYNVDDSMKDVFQFFQSHKGHPLVIEDEYGRKLGECSKRVKCPSCGHDDVCRQDVGHNGECK